MLWGSIGLFRKSEMKIYLYKGLSDRPSSGWTYQGQELGLLVVSMQNYQFWSLVVPVVG